MTKDELIWKTSRILGKSTKHMTLNQVIIELVEKIESQRPQVTQQLSPEHYAIAEANGISRDCLYQRIKRKWSIEAAITKPLKNKKI